MLICKYQNWCFSELGVLNHLIQLLAYLGYTSLIGAIDNKYDGIDFIEIMFPQTCGLTRDIPKSEAVASIGDLFYVEANGGNCLLVFVVFHLE